MLAALALLCLAPMLAAAEPLPEGARLPRAPRALVLSLSGHAYPRLCRAFSHLGIDARRYASLPELLAAWRPNALVVLPGAETARLSREQACALAARIRAGLPVLLDGHSLLNMLCGMAYVDRPVTLKEYRWVRQPAAPVRLPAALTLPGVVRPPGATVLADVPATGQPVVVAGRVGEGRFCYSAIPLEPQAGELYACLPHLSAWLFDDAGLRPAFIAPALHYYLDWGFYYRQDPVALADALQARQVRLVHLSAWYEGAEYRAFVSTFLAAAHQRGMQVYCWFEFPMVSAAFWQRHPQWREMTAAGTEAKIDWRCHMALEDPACLAAVTALLAELVGAFDWDGVNLAELYFESPFPAKTYPHLFTPMHPAFRERFRKRHHVDPIELFAINSPHYLDRQPELYARLVEMRIELVTELNAEMLRALAGCRQRKPEMAVTLTLMDSTLDPAMREMLGVDIPALLALREIVPFTVQVEDPMTTWPAGSSRFAPLGAWYRARLAADVPFVINLNIVDRWEGLPSPRPTGLELAAWVAEAFTHADAVSLYAWNTLSEEERWLAAVAAARDGRILDEATGQYQAARPFTWVTPLREQAPLLDGAPWPCYDDEGVLLPAGTHAVCAVPAPDAADALRVTGLSGTLLAAARRDGILELHYASSARCYVSLNRLPARLRVDSRELPVVNAGTPQASVLALPPGEHQAEFE